MICGCNSLLHNEYFSEIGFNSNSRVVFLDNKVVQAQITPIPTPRSSPAPSPAPTEHDNSNPREEPSLEGEEHKGSFIKKYEQKNGEHIQEFELPPVEVIDKNATILNGIAGKSKVTDDKRRISDKETLEMNKAVHQPVNR